MECYMMGDPNSLWYGYDLPQTWFKRSDGKKTWRSRSREERKCGMYEHLMALDHPETPATAFRAKWGVNSTFWPKTIDKWLDLYNF